MDLTRSFEQLTKSNSFDHSVGVVSGTGSIDGNSTTKGGNLSISHGQAGKLTNSMHQSHGTNTRDFREAVLLTVHSEMNNISKRSNDVVVSGLPPKHGVTDSDLFRDMCFDHLSTTIEIVRTKRLGVNTGKIQPLLVTVPNQESATRLVELSRTLRSSSDQSIREKVYINRHLTKAEASAAYALRCNRRSKNKTSATSEAAKDTSPRIGLTLNQTNSTLLPGELDTHAMAAFLQANWPKAGNIVNAQAFNNNGTTATVPLFQHTSGPSTTNSSSHGPDPSTPATSTSG